MILNLLCCLILQQPRTYGMLNRIVDPSNNLCIVCFSCIYQSSIPGRSSEPLKYNSDLTITNKINLLYDRENQIESKRNFIESSYSILKWERTGDLNEKKYSYWSYAMRNFLKGKKIWGYVSGTSVIPRNTTRIMLL